MRQNKIVVGLYLSTGMESGGIFQYSLSVLDALSSLDRQNLLDLKIAYHGSEWPSFLIDQPNKVRKLKWGKLGILFSKCLLGLMLPGGFSRNFLSKLNPVYYELKKLEADVWIYPGQDLFSYQMPFKSLSTIHDLMHIYEPTFSEASSWYRYQLRQHRFKNSVKNSVGILVDSDLGRVHVCQSYGSDGLGIYKLPFIPQVKVSFTKKEETETLERLAVPQQFLFYPAQFWPHKNHKILIDASNNILNYCGDFNLVLTGSKTLEYKKLTALCKKLGLETRVHFLGRVSDKELGILYQNAKAMIMPTFFGPTNIPPLEAIQYGCPVAVSNNYAMPEQLGEAAIYFDPSSLAEIETCILTLWNDQEVRKRLIAEGYKKSQEYTQENFASNLMAVLHSVVSK